MSFKTRVFSLFSIALFIGITFNQSAFAQNKPGKSLIDSAASGKLDRQFWIAQLDKLVRPVLLNMAEDNLKKNMPVVVSKRSDNPESRKNVAYLEVLGRTMSGIAPWLNLEGGDAKEVALRNEYRQLSLKAIANAVNPQAKDYVEWYKGSQPLVDASYLALTFLRCPWLWNHLSETTKSQVVDGFKLTRKVTPGYNNWLLFSGMMEAFFCQFGYEWDGMRVDYGFRQTELWYVGDGYYSDGPQFHLDNYNSYVIHPYLAKMAEVFAGKVPVVKDLSEKIKARNERYAIIQERLINSDGSYPATGRSIVYRGAAFQHLADMALRKQLPLQLKPAQIRCALTAVIKKTMLASGTYSKDGWLNIGICGSQPDLADVYNNTGSLYICSNIFLPLGLPETDDFWSGVPVDWTEKRIWNGEDVRGDHAL